MTSRRAEVASRAGTTISCRRMVAVLALAWTTDAMAPAARMRLNAIAANTNHALLDENWPEGRCARGPLFMSAMTCSTMAWSRWVVSAWSMTSGESVKMPWCR